MTHEKAEIEQAMQWIKHLPGYRELIKQRVHEAQKRVMIADNKRERRRGPDIDKVGRDIEGCG